MCPLSGAFLMENAPTVFLKKRKTEKLMLHTKTVNHNLIELNKPYFGEITL